MDILLVALATVAVVVAAAVPAAALAGRSFASFVLAVWLFAWVEVVTVAVGLSLVDAFTRGPVLVAYGLLLAAAVAAKRRRGIRLPAIQPAARRLREALHDPVLAVLVCTSAAAFAYVTALGIWTAPNEDDALAYHLLRAAFWKQNHSIGWLGPLVDGRANAFPPLAEIGVSSTMVIGGTERLVGLPQLVGLPAAAVAAFALARRIGLDVRAALFGALCLFLLPFPLLQSQTALNDVVLMGLTGAAAVFALGRRNQDLLLAGIAVALMVATKTPAFLAFPSLALLVLLAQPRRRLPFFAVAAAISIVLGSGWYLFTHAHTGSLSGGLEETNVPDDRLDVVDMAGRFLRYLLSTLELPAAVGRDRLLYLLAGALLVGAGVLLRRRAAVVAGVVVASAVLLVPVARALNRAWLEGWQSLGRGALGELAYPLDPPYARGTGPVGLLLIVVSTVVGVRLLRRGRLPRAAAALLVAPFASLLALAVVVRYSMDNPRLVLGGVVLAAGTWGLAYRVRAVAIAAAALSIIVSVTAVTWYPKKPSGVRLLEPAHERSAWTRPRWVLQEREGGTAPFLRLVSEAVPETARIAVRSGIDSYTFFGPRLRRHVDLVTAGATGIAADWLVTPVGDLPACALAWREVPGPRGQPWELFRRTRPGCPGP